MPGITIFHNPRCSKSRAALAAAESAGVTVIQVPYLDAPPDRSTLEGIVEVLEDPVTDLVRSGDARAAGVEVSGLDAAGVIDVLIAHPELMERPVLVAPGHAIIGRPTDRVGPFLARHAG